MSLLETVDYVPERPRADAAPDDEGQGGSADESGSAGSIVDDRRRSRASRKCSGRTRSDFEALIGSRLGQFRIDRLLGAGTMGRVYLGEHLDLGRWSAIKVIHPEVVARKPGIRERFRAEARAIAGLVHSNIVTVHNLGSDRGYDYIEMEYVAGSRTLQDEVVKQGPLPVAEATRLVRQLALALSHAHEAGLIHRDVKPSNVLLTPEGRAKLADFGLVYRELRPRSGAASASRATQVGGSATAEPAVVAGTPTFMAPELFSGRPATVRSDIYALGVTYYYMLLTRLPFLGASLSELMRKHRREPVPVGPDSGAEHLPGPVLAILKCCLAKRPSQRFGSAEELAAALKAAVEPARDVAAMIRDALRGLDCFILGGPEKFRVLVMLGEDRMQEVFLELQPGRVSRRQLAIFCVCGAASSGHHEFMLRLNAKLLGGISIREFGGEPMYFMTRTFDEQTVRPAEIRAAVEEIARRGDWVERRLSRYDVF